MTLKIGGLFPSCRVSNTAEFQFTIFSEPKPLSCLVPWLNACNQQSILKIFPGLCDLMTLINSNG